MAIVVPFSKASAAGVKLPPITDPFAQMALAQTVADRKKATDGKAAE